MCVFILGHVILFYENTTRGNINGNHIILINLLRVISLTIIWTNTIIYEQRKEKLLYL